MYQLGNWKAGKTREAVGYLAERIVPTGELEGRQDEPIRRMLVQPIVPTGELEGRQDHGLVDDAQKLIVPTGELEGRQDEW